MIADEPIRNECSLSAAETHPASELAQQVASAFHDRLRAALVDVHPAIAEVALDAFRQAVEGAPAFPRCGIEFYDYENQVGFWIIDLAGHPISGRVRIGDMVSLAAKMDKYRRRKNPA